MWIRGMVVGKQGIGAVHKVKVSCLYGERIVGYG